MAPPPTNESKIEEANRIAKTNPAKAEGLFKDVLAKPPGSNEAALRNYENALAGLGELYRDNKKAEELAELVKTSRSTLSSFAKAKTAKLGECSLNEGETALTVSSAATTRLLWRYSQYSRDSDSYDKVLYRMGNFREEIVPQTESGNTSRRLVYAEAIVL